MIIHCLRADLPADLLPQVLLRIQVLIIIGQRILELLPSSEVVP